MEINPHEIRLDHFHHGPGNGASWKATHLPKGIWVGEFVSRDSKESQSVIRLRLLDELTRKLEDNGGHPAG